MDFDTIALNLVYAWKRLTSGLEKKVIYDKTNNMWNGQSQTFYKRKVWTMDMSVTEEG